MTTPRQPALPRLVILLLYVIGAWASLAALLYAGMWQPADTAMQAGRVILLTIAGVALVLCVLGATSKMLAASAAGVPDPDPKA